MPNYQGYIPGKDSNNELGRTFSKVTRKCFDQAKLDNKPFMFSTTGFNQSKLPRTDSTLFASTHKYGKCTLQPTHPCVDDKNWTTTARNSWRKPVEHNKPTSRRNGTQSQVKFDNGLLASYRPSTTASGFGTGMKLFDGHNWMPMKNMHSDNVRTEYRNRFNKDKPFHHTVKPMTTGRMAKRVLVYDLE